MGRLKLVTHCGSSSLSLASFGSFEWRKVIRLAGLPWPLSRTHFLQWSTKHGRLRSPCIVLLGLALCQTYCLYRLMAVTSIKVYRNGFLNELFFYATKRRYSLLVTSTNRLHPIWQWYPEGGVNIPLFRQQLFKVRCHTRRTPMTTSAVASAVFRAREKVRLLHA